MLRLAGDVLCAYPGRNNGAEVVFPTGFADFEDVLIGRLIIGAREKFKKFRNLKFEEINSGYLTFKCAEVTLIIHSHPHPF